MGRFCFTPDERCIGGAQQINDEIQNMQRKIYEASSKVKRWKSSRSNSHEDPRCLAETLSLNRQRKNALSDQTMWNHCNNLFHLQRRISEQSNYTERKKNALDFQIYPVRIHRRPSHSSFRTIFSRPLSARPPSNSARKHSQSAHGVPNSTVFALYRDSILRTIAAEEEPTEFRVKQIFDSYILDTPLEHQEILLDVIQYISNELEI